MKFKKVIRIVAKTIVGIIVSLIVLLLLVILLIRLPTVQTYLTRKAATYVSQKTHTKVQLTHIYLAFPKSVVIEGLFAEDTHHDTLLYLGKLKVNIDMMALTKKKVEVRDIYLADVNANIARSSVDSIYNFNFLIKAFAGSGKKKEPEVKPKTDTTAGWQIQVDKLKLENIRGSFADGVTGTTIKGNVGHLDLDMRKMDIKHLSFTGHTLSLADADVSIIQSRENNSVEDSTKALLPLLALDRVDLKHVSFLYKHIPHGQSYEISVSQLTVIPDQIDLNGQSIKVKSLHLSDSHGQIAMRKNEEVVRPATNKTSADTSHNQDWHIAADTIVLEHIDFAYDRTNVPRKAQGLDYDHIGLHDVSVSIVGGSYSADNIKADIRNISLHEQSGFDLKSLSAKGQYTATGAHLQNLKVVTSRSQISKSDIAVTWPSIRSLADNIGAMGINADLQPMNVDVRDILVFAPQLSKQLPAIDGNKVSVHGRISGTLNNITAQNLYASAGPQTEVLLTGHVIGLPDALHATYDVDIANASSTKNELLLFLKNKLPSSIDIPASFAVTGHVKGSIADAKADLVLKSTSGDVSVNATLVMAKGDTQYTAKINTASLDLGYILKKSDLLGNISASIEAKGQNFSLQSMIADVVAKINAITFKQYTYRDIQIDACADKGAYDAEVSIKDTNVIADIMASYMRGENEQKVNLYANITGVNLQKTKLIDRDLRTGAKLYVDFSDSADNINGNAHIDNITVLQAEKSYEIDSMRVTAKSDTGHLRVTLRSDIADADYDGTSRVQDLSKSLTAYINSYFTLSAGIDTMHTDTLGQDFKLTADVYPHPLITEVLVPQIKKFNGASLSAEYHGGKRKLDVGLSASALAYGGIKVNNIQALIHSVNDSLKYNIGLDQLSAGPVKLTKTELSGSLKDNAVDFKLNIQDSTGGDKLLISGDLKQPEPKSYALHLDNDDLIISQGKWQLSPDNKIMLSGAGLNIHAFDLSRNGESISIASQTDAPNAPIKVEFKAFDIGTLSQIVESDTALLRGYMNGSVELRNLAGSPAFVSDLSIDSISFEQHPIGNISLKADNLSANKYTASLALTGADNDVQINGSYINAPSGDQLSFKTNIKALHLQSIEPFTSGQMRRSKGYLTGSVDISGTPKHPLINGDVSFKDAATNVAYINNYITLKEDHIKVDGQGIYFNSFTILDSLGQKAVIDGSVHTTDFRKMKFDMSVRMDKFTVLNTTIDDNPLFFGKVILSSQIKVTGNESLPVVKANVQILDNTNLAVIIPSSKISVDRGDGVVVMVNHNDTVGILARKDTVMTKLQFKGIDVTANVDISKQAYFKLIVDKQTGDSLVVNGEGRLSFLMDPSGNQNLTGTYKLSGGSYVATIEKVIHKRFKIKEGSTITWNGRPEDAEIDISAIYAVRASSADLLATELAVVPEDQRAPYKKPLNFLVYLNVKGELLKPEISFKLDMIDADKAAFSGTVYSKVTSVNDNPEELNKQVFSLLVLNQFLPSGSGSGDADYGAVATNLARNSVNNVLADQLNKLSDKYIKGVDLNFGLQSNDEYSQGSVQQNTQVSIGLKKTFFKDRLGVQVGTSINVPNSNASATQYNASNITGDIVLDYKLTPDGRYHFKAFRVNQYEGIIDGLLYKTGISVQYNRDFNALKELFRRPHKAEPKPKEKSE